MKIEKIISEWGRKTSRRRTTAAGTQATPVPNGMKRVQAIVRFKDIGLVTRHVNVALVLAMMVFAGTAYAQEAYDYCDNLEGIQETMPAGYSSVGSPQQCYELQAPVTIDLTPPGGEPVTIDTNPVDEDGKSGPAQTIDVNPSSGGGVSEKTEQMITASIGEVSMSTTTPKLITSIEELQAYIFAPETPVADRIVAIENHIKGLMEKLIEVLIAEIEALEKAKNEAE